MTHMWVSMLTWKYNGVKTLSTNVLPSWLDPAHHRMNQWRYWAHTRAVGGHRLTSRSSARIGNARLIHTAKGPLLKGTPGAKAITFLPPGSKQEGAGRKRQKTACRAALGCFWAGAGRAGSWQGHAKNCLRSCVRLSLRAGAGRAGNAKNCLRSCVRLFLRAGGWPSRRRQKHPKTAYGAALICFCGPGACRAGNAKNCLLGCVRLFLRAGGWRSRKRQKLPTGLR